MIYPQTPIVLLDCIAKQNTIGWGHFIRGRLSSSLYIVLNKYFLINKIGRRFKSLSWYRNIIKLLWQLHHTDWLEYCNNIHSSTKPNILQSPTKNTLITLI